MEEKRDINILRKIQNNQFDMELVIRHNKRMEKVLRRIKAECESGYTDFIKVFHIEKFIKEIEDYI